MLCPGTAWNLEVFPMADSKQYITQVQENGNVMISEDVVATIVTQALFDVEGLAGLDVKPGADLADLIVKNWGKGMKILIGENNELSIDCSVLVKYGSSVIEVAKNAQSAVIAAVESMTGVKVAVVNINVCGIARQ